MKKIILSLIIGITLLNISCSSSESSKGSTKLSTQQIQNLQKINGLGFGGN